MLPPVPQPARFIDPLSDFGFKRLFGSEPNKEILIDFLNQLFKDQAVPKVIRDLTYHSTEKYGEDEQSKKIVFDLLCTCDNGEQILVEMQRAEQPYIKERAVFYTSRLISEQLPKGKKSWNYALKGVYLIALLEFEMEAGKGDYLYDYCLTDRATGEIFYEKLGYKFIELPKFTKAEHQLVTDLDRWLFLLKNLSRMDKIPVFLRKKVFQKVFRIAEISGLTKEERMLYQTKEQIEFDYQSSVEFAAKKAADKARLENTEKAIRNMIREGSTTEFICKVLEVSPDYVARIRDSASPSS